MEYSSVFIYFAQELIFKMITVAKDPISRNVCFVGLNMSKELRLVFEMKSVILLVLVTPLLWCPEVKSLHPIWRLGTWSTWALIQYKDVILPV